MCHTFLHKKKRFDISSSVAKNTPINQSIVRPHRTFHIIINVYRCDFGTIVSFYSAPDVYCLIGVCILKFRQTFIDDDDDAMGVFVCVRAVEFLSILRMVDHVDGRWSLSSENLSRTGSRSCI